MAINSKAQAGAAFISFIGLLFGGLFYFLGMAKYVSEYMSDKIAAGTLTGVEGFFLAYFNFFVAIIWIICLLVLGRYSLV